ncbi:hypothetical protein GP486_000800 [Trichoglossum hirsutum]|uniref:U3 small nucleolar RNA-associated protein 11 n=1 Tax=Trichoglossum hirsutum TaxID=265104 RepID=A0A9P8LI93_9PEZI|nr:hypothetical protein GP486_000800 [Trichoglossum hirsutum]
MSSMRNAIQRRNHRERAQPLERQKWGILEKHKDYSLRARDYNAKQARLKVLREKAAERNPDEFYFGMMSSKTSRGGQIVADRGNKALSLDVVRLLKTQDTGYLRTMAQIEGRKKRRLQETFVMGEVGGNPSSELSGKDNRKEGKHLVFVESKEEQKAFDAQEHFRTDADASTTRKSSAEAIPGDEETQIRESTGRRQSKQTTREGGRKKRAQRAQEVRRKMIDAVKTRERELIAAERELDLQRAKMGKSANVGGTTKGGVKWKRRERKR